VRGFDSAIGEGYLGELNRHARISLAEALATIEAWPTIRIIVVRIRPGRTDAERIRTAQNAKIDTAPCGENDNSTLLNLSYGLREL
jgi:hypothetical protein